MTLALSITFNVNLTRAPASFSLRLFKNVIFSFSCNFIQGICYCTSIVTNALVTNGGIDH